MNEKITRIIVIAVTAAIHIFIIFFLVFETNVTIQEIPEAAKVMRLIDLEELPPPAPPPPPMPPPPPPTPSSDIPRVEAISEVMVETDVVPEQEIVAAGTLIDTPEVEEYIPMHMLTTRPFFDEAAIRREIVYPPIAQRSGVEGWVMLNLAIDRNGIIRDVTIIQEEPPERHFGEAAIRAFLGREVIPAMVEGEPVPCYFRRRVEFKLR